MNHPQFLLSRLSALEHQLNVALREVALRHPDDYQLQRNCMLFAGWSEDHILALQNLMRELQIFAESGPFQQTERLQYQPMPGTELLLDLENLLAVAHRVRTAWIPLEEVAKVHSSSCLAQLVCKACSELDRAIAWVETELKTSAPQALTVG